MSITGKDDFHDDLAALIAGELPQTRVREILARAESDPVLARALAQEKSLDRLLNFYEVPEPSAALRKQFWTRFHSEKLLGQSGMVESSRGRLWLKLAGPIAAALVITLGLIFWPNGRGQGPGLPDNTPVAENTDDGDDLIEVMYGSAPEDTSPNAEQLRHLKLLDDARLAALDAIQQPDDLKLIDQFDLLSELDDEEGG